MLPMVDQIRALAHMKPCRLDTKNTLLYTAKELLAACERIENCGLTPLLPSSISERVQKELIQDKDFAGFFYELLAADVNVSSISDWLLEADRFEEVLRDTFTVGQLIQASKLGICQPAIEYEYLKFFSTTVTEDAQHILVDNLNHIFVKVPFHLSDLTGIQREQLLLPYFKTYIRPLEKSLQSVQKALDLLAANPALRDILAYLYAENVIMALPVNRLDHLTWLKEEDAEILAQVFFILGDSADHMASFLDIWLDNGAPPYELKWFSRHTTPLPENEVDNILGSRLGYMNAVYSGKLTIPFEQVRPKQMSLLLYAVNSKKRRFLELVSENFEIFSSLNDYSMLFLKDFYQRCNLNTLTAKNLADSQGQWRQTTYLHLLENREYTYTELNLLCYAQPVYGKFYGLLGNIGVDRQLVVLRELLKKDLLSDDMTDEHLRQLAACLSVKPLSVWRQKELSHIKGLSASDALRVLQVYDQLLHLLPDIHAREDALFAARNILQVQKYESWDQVRENILQEDQDWLYLTREMGFTPSFVEENKTNILRFLLKGGSEMTRIYYDGIDNQDALRRIVQAELMGKFSALKYFPDDLEREISFPLQEAQTDIWQKNTSVESENFTAGEADDFYTTLQLGELPHRTCLSYKDGMHRECVLSGYDSNKKILLAWKGSTVVGRAVIRLTKGCLHLPERDMDKKPSLEFADFSQTESNRQIEKGNRELLTLFLERPYFSQIDTSEEQTVMRMFVSLVREKAEQMNAVSVLAAEYQKAYLPGDYIRMRYFLYISKSKSGAQYLDSLSGEATVSKEGRYERGMFYVPPDAVPSEDAAAK